MGLVDIGLAVGIAAVLGCIGWYLHRSKKRGRKCIGCPEGGHCSGNCGQCGGK